MFNHRVFSMDNPKAAKASSYGWLNGIHYMAPASLAGVGNLCPFASAGCKALCLGWESGQAGMVSNDADINSVRKSRIDKARLFMGNRAEYLAHVAKAIRKAIGQAERKGLKLCIRLNGSTDIAWEGIKAQGQTSLIEANPNVQFTDYTKSAKRALAHAQGKLPSNLHLTFSRSETNEAQCLEVLAAGGNVAIVFGCERPATWHGYQVIDGDQHDLRHLDPRGCVVGLTPKGRKAKRDTSGFVLH